MKNTLTIVFAVFVFASCTKTQFTQNKVSSGSANFTTYIAVGNSLTQGYMDNGLYAYGQSHSYPEDLSGQMKLACPNMGSFLQPNVTGNGSGHIHLAYVNGQIDPITPTDSTYTTPDGPDPSWANWGLSYQNQVMNNMGISGITLTACVALTASEKAYNNFFCSIDSFGRFMNFGTLDNIQQYVDHIRTSGATFFTCWLGDNDVLGYALNGGVPTIVIADTIYEITPPSVFAQKYDTVLTVFHKLGAQGVCVTIPNVTSIPYFNTVPSYVLVNGQRKYFWITTGTGAVRQATDNDLILLKAYDSVQKGYGTTAATALHNDQVLDEVEVAAVQQATLEYNASIKSLASQFGYAVCDMYTFLAQMQKSMTIDGVTFSRTFISGGTFGLDGIHPNARGYAVVTNQLILAINAKYGSTLPQVDISKYEGIIFPNF